MYRSVCPMASIEMTAMTQGNYTEAFAQRSFYMQKLLRRDIFTQRSLCTGSLYTKTLLHREAFAQRSLYTEELLDRGALTQIRLCTQEAFLTEKSLHGGAFTHDAFTQRSF